MFQTTGSRGIAQRVGFNRNYRFRFTDPYNNNSISIFDALAAIDKNSNMIMNPTMEIDQVNAGAAYTGAGAAAFASFLDGISSNSNGSPTARFTIQQTTDAPPGYKKCAKVSCTTTQTLTTTQYFYLYTTIEGHNFKRMGWGTSNAQPLALGFWVKAFQTGMFSGSVGNNAGNRQYNFTYVINQSNVWEYKTILIPGDVTGTWNTGNFTQGWCYIYWITCIGPSLNGPANAWQGAGFNIGVSGATQLSSSTSNTWQITGITAHPGNILVPVTRAPFLMPKFNDALRFCQRYYEKTWNVETAVATATSVGNENWGIGENMSGSISMIFKVNFKVLKLADPTMTAYSPSTGASGHGRDTISNADCAATFFNAGQSGVALELDATAAGATASMSAHWTADARM